MQGFYWILGQIGYFFCKIKKSNSVSEGYNFGKLLRTILLTVWIYLYIWPVPCKHSFLLYWIGFI